VFAVLHMSSHTGLQAMLAQRAGFAGPACLPVTTSTVLLFDSCIGLNCLLRLRSSSRKAQVVLLLLLLLLPSA
jgi:hypothetical protein